MQSSRNGIALIEKIVSVISYLTMGIGGLVWFIIAYFLKKQLKFFLLYNILQSIIISVVLAILKLVVDIVFSILSFIPFLNYIIAKTSFYLSFKAISIPFLGLSYSIVELFITLLILYIIIGVIMGRIFYIPYLTVFMEKILKKYR